MCAHLYFLDGLQLLERLLKLLRTSIERYGPGDDTTRPELIEAIVLKHELEGPLLYKVICSDAQDLNLPVDMHGVSEAK
jgi:hypothetical protein